ncbi:MAG: glycosyltransferase family 39 protein [Candidatus Schekmanbacteria bacterium]|nr:glycosyltransferase family 39 protein [Candidatus Schekmanbacteria bacterium]
MNNERTNYQKVYLVILFVGGLLIRLWGIDFGLPLKYARPDEEGIVEAALYFFTGDFNPHFYYYPHAFIYLNYFVYLMIYCAGRIGGIYGNTFDFIQNYLLDPSIFFIVPRVLSAIAGTLTILAVYLLGTRCYGKNAGLFSALFISVSYLHVRDSHFGTTDIILTMAVIISLIAIRKIMKEGNGYILSGLLAGLATGIKYNGAILVIPIIVAHVIYNIRKNGWMKGIINIKKLLLSGVIMIFAFIITSPGLFLEFATFMKRLIFMSNFLREYNGFNPEPGRTYFLKILLPIGMGFPLFCLSIIGVFYACIKHTDDDVLILSFPLCYYFHMWDNYGVFVRYAIPVIPFFCIFAGRIAAKFFSKFSEGMSYKKFLYVVVIIFIVMPSLWKSLKFDSLISKEDTRLIAKRWIETNVAPGTAIYLFGYYKYYFPELNFSRVSIDNDMEYLKKSMAYAPSSHSSLYFMSYSYLLEKRIIPMTKSFDVFIGTDVTNNYIDKQNIKYIVTGDYFVDYYSGQNFMIRPLLKKKFHLVKEFSPYNNYNKVAKESYFDPLDAFYLPFEGFEGIANPGPLLQIYELNNNSNILTSPSR